MTGIQERRFWESPTEKPSIGATKAALKLQESLEGIDAILYTGVCRDRIEPATAAYVHKALKLSEKTFLMDLSNACVGFLNGMFLAKQLIASGAMQRVLVVASENGESLVESTIHTLLTAPLNRQSIKPYFANLTIGAGAVAMVLSAENALLKKPLAQLGGFYTESDTQAVELCEGQEALVDGQVVHTMSTDSELLLHAGLSLAKKTWDRFEAIRQKPELEFQKILTHQVGKQHANALYQALGFPQDKGFFTYPSWGNVGSVSLPLTFAKWIEDASSLSGPVALLGIGSGLTCMMGELLPPSV